MLTLLAGGLLAVALATTGAAAADRPRQRPNVLWFIAEDLSPHLGAYGDPVAQTPTIDRLAAEGVRFDVVYSDAPVCAPSRLFWPRRSIRATIPAYGCSR